MSTLLPLQPGVLAKPTCWPATPQALYTEMFAKGFAVMPDVNGVLVQDDAPAPEFRGVAGWIPTSGDVPIFPGGGVFVWHAVIGHWVCRHAKAASDPRPEMYIGSLVDLPTFDGGDTGGAGEASGPMWEQWTDINGRVPVGVGTIPGSSPAASVAAPLDTTDSLGNVGEYKHALTGAEGAVANHTHPFGLSVAGDDAFFSYVTPPVSVPTWSRWFVTGGGGASPGTETTADLYTLQAADGAGVTSAGHITMPPWIGVYWIKRTTRDFYRAG